MWIGSSTGFQPISSVFSQHLSSLDPPAGHKHGEGEGVVVPARVGLLPHPVLPQGSPPELAPPDHQSAVQQTPLFEVLQEGGDGLITHHAVEGQARVQVAVVVPGSMVDVDEAHPPLHQAPGQEAIAREGRKDSGPVAWIILGLTPALFAAIDAIHLQRFLTFTREIDELGGRCLHPEGQLV